MESLRVSALYADSWRSHHTALPTIRFERPRFRYWLPVAVLLAGILPVFAASRGWTPYDLPSPQDDNKNVCQRHSRVQSILCDPDGLVSRDEAMIIDGLANFIAEGSHGYSLMNCAGRKRGYQVAVAVVGRMAADGRSLPNRVKHFATELHDAWGVGDAECNNGIMLFIAFEDHQMYMSVGAAAKHWLTGKRVQNILDTMKPALREERVGLAIERGVDQIGKVLAGGEVEAVSNETPFAFIPAAIMGMVFLCTSCFRSSSRSRYSKCQNALRRLENDRGLARRSQYRCVSCPICLEDFDSPQGDESISSSSKTQLDSWAATEPSASASGSATATAVQRVTAGYGAAGASGSRPSDVTKRPVETDTKSDLQPTQPTEQVLQCGHKFHIKCLEDMLKTPSVSSEKCPICREPMFRRRPGHGTDASPGDTHRPGDDLPSHGAARPTNQDMRGYDHFYPEYMFRLGRAHTMYPDYVTRRTMNRWGTYGYVGPISQDSTFRGTDPRVRADARSAGGGGSSFSFGGGGSSGGSGGGSSW